MQDGRTSAAGLTLRPAADDDYPSFCRLFPELLVADPLPGPEIWASTLLPTTRVASRGSEVLGYCYFQEYTEVGYVRNIVVAPAARLRGVGRALMQAVATELRARGKTSWRLNVKPDNRAALALYERMGMHPKYSAKAFRLAWSALNALPLGDAVVRSLEVERDLTFEAQFDLPRGQLGSARRIGRTLLEATSAHGQVLLGLAVFDPKFPGAFPFRLAEIDALTPLLRAMRECDPTSHHVNLVAEDDERLANLLASVGAELRFDILHYEGAL